MSPVSPVIPTGADHREGDDLRSGGISCFLGEEHVEIESEWTTRKHESGGRNALSSSRNAPLKPKPGLSGPPVPILSVKYTANAKHGCPFLAFFARSGVRIVSCLPPWG